MVRTPYHYSTSIGNMRAMIEYGLAQDKSGWAKRSYKPRPWKEVLNSQTN